MHAATSSPQVRSRHDRVAGCISESGDAQACSRRPATVRLRVVHSNEGVVISSRPQSGMPGGPVALATIGYFSPMRVAVHSPGLVVHVISQSLPRDTNA